MEHTEPEDINQAQAILARRISARHEQGAGEAPAESAVVLLGNYLIVSAMKAETEQTGLHDVYDEGLLTAGLGLEAADCLASTCLKTRFMRYVTSLSYAKGHVVAGISHSPKSSRINERKFIRGIIDSDPETA